jgi:hypothetical protein
MRDRTAVHESHLDRLAFADMNDRAGGTVAVEGPRVELHPRRDLDDHVLQGHLHLDEVPAGDHRKRSVGRGMSLGQVGGVLGNDTGEAVERKRRVVVCRLTGRHRSLRHGWDRACDVGGIVALPGVGPHQEGKEAQDGDQDAQEDDGNLEESAGVRVASSVGGSRRGVGCHRFSPRSLSVCTDRTKHARAPQGGAAHVVGLPAPSIAGFPQSPDHSYRSASEGRTRAARRAGATVAIIATR